MQTRLSPEFVGTSEGEAAERELRKCVHCGFCNATCPTHRVFGDELDGPRGRIYLMKQVFEGQPVTRSTQEHLDRCITCLHCETTCPSGVQYGALLEVGRRVVDRKVTRPISDKAKRWLLREGVTSSLFGPALKMGQSVRGLLPQALRNKVPMRSPLAQVQWPDAQAMAAHPRQVLLLNGCVQPDMRPSIDAATARVLHACGVGVSYAPQSGCCGALKSHLSDEEGAKAQMRRNIDAWWPYIAQQKAEALVINASGCGSAVKDYGHWLADDAQYADKAKAVSAWAQDIGTWFARQGQAITDQLQSQGINPHQRGTIAFHPPCSLSHAQGIKGETEQWLRGLGFDIQNAACDPLQCCGAGGAYSVLQPQVAKVLRDEKLRQLNADRSAVVASSNIGCIVHLQSGTSVPVKHWIELLDEALASAA